MRSRTLIAALAPGLFLAPAAARPAGAAAPAPPTIYATATVTERPASSATVAVTVLERDTLESAGADSVADVLPFVPGVSLLSGGTRGGLTAAQVRGGDPNFTRVLVDGVPVDDDTYQVGGIFNFEALPALAVERVEVVRGPLSAFYGSTGLAGAIQVITRRGEGPLNAALDLAAGNAQARRAAFSLGGASRGGAGDDAFFLSLLGEGEEERVADESYELLHVQGRADRRLGGRTALRLAGRLAEWRADDYPDASGGPLGGSGELRRSESSEAGFSASFVLDPRGGRSHRFEASLYRHDRDRESPAVVPLVPASLETTRFTRLRAGWASSWAFSPRSPSNELDLVASLGADVELDRGENDSLLELPPFLGGDVPGDYGLERTTSGVFVELTARRGPLTAELGLRADFPEEAADPLSARLGLRYALGTGGTRLRASLGRSFKLPSFFALASPPALGGNPALRPEVMEGGDLGVERLFAGGRGNYSLTVFAQRFHDLVDFDFEQFTHLNRSEVDAAGVELAATWRPGPAWTAAANVTFQEVEDRATGETLLHRPRWSGALRVDWRAKRLGLSGDLRLTSSVRDRQIPVPERDEVPGRTLLGLAASWRASPHVRLALRVENVLDERYETLIGFPGPGRAVRLTLRFNLGKP